MYYGVHITNDLLSGLAIRFKTGLDLSRLLEFKLVHLQNFTETQKKLIIEASHRKKYVKKEVRFSELAGDCTIFFLQKGTSFIGFWTYHIIFVGFTI